MVAPLKSSRPRFNMGQIVATPGALRELERSGESPAKFLSRHIAGDWGEVDAGDWQLNDRAVTEETRILSAYRTSRGEKLWIITEADRSSTCLLLPEEY
jgi:hypothetical protein